MKQKAKLKLGCKTGGLMFHLKKGGNVKGYDDGNLIQEMMNEKLNTTKAQPDATATPVINTAKNKTEVKHTVEDPKRGATDGIRGAIQKGINYAEEKSNLTFDPLAKLGLGLITSPVQSGLNIANTAMGDRPIRNDADINVFSCKEAY